MNGSTPLIVMWTKRDISSGVFAQNMPMAVALCLRMSIPLASLITINSLALLISQTQALLSSSHKNKYLSYKLIKYPKLTFFQMIPDLNFDPSNERNYTAEEPSGSSFFTGIFPNYDKNNFYPNHVLNIIYNFNQGEYYTNYPYNSSIYSYLYPSIYQQSNPAVPPCHTYNFFGDSSSSTYDQSNFQYNYGNLADDRNLNVFTLICVLVGPKSKIILVAIVILIQQ
jgi:hypothetical protein